MSRWGEIAISSLWIKLPVCLYCERNQADGEGGAQVGEKDLGTEQIKKNGNDREVIFVLSLWSFTDTRSHFMSSLLTPSIKLFGTMSCFSISAKLCLG